MVHPQLALNNKIAEVKAALDADPAALNKPAAVGLFDGRTLLMCASSRGHAELAAELLRRGADARPAGKRGETAESLARGAGHTQLADTLAQAAVKGPAPAAAAAPASTKRAREPTAAPAPAPSASSRSPGNKKARVGAAPPPSASALAQMAQLGNSAALFAALDAHPTLLNQPAVGGLFDGRTLLMCAGSRGHEALVTELLRRGADASASSKLGDTAESLARKQGHTRIADALHRALTAGATTATAGGSGGTGDGDGKRRREPEAETEASPPASKLRASAPPFVPPATSAAASGSGSGSGSASSMTVRIHVTARAESLSTGASDAYLQLIVHSVADAEHETLRSALDAAAAQQGGVRWVEPRDAGGKPMDAAGDVFTLWLEHGDTGESFDTDLNVWVTAERAQGSGEGNGEDDEADAPPSGGSGREEASSIYDILAGD